VDGHDVRVPAELAHRLRLALDALAPGGVQPLRLDHGEGDLAVQAAVASAIDLLAASLAKEPDDPVAAADERVRKRWRGCRWVILSRSWRCGLSSLGHLDERRSVGVLRVNGQHRARLLQHRYPLAGGSRLVRFVEKRVDSPLDSFAWHGGREDNPHGLTRRRGRVVTRRHSPCVGSLTRRPSELG
jgi:hypothetical protein